MTKNIHLRTGLISAAILSSVLTGCIVRESGRYQTGSAQTTVVFEDDYDYYPGYEVYYSRNRHEYVYRDGNTWVRRPGPRGVSVDVLLAAPSVRVDFHDSPAQHHSNVVRSYPRNWQQPAPKNKDRDDHRKDDGKRN